MSTQTNELASTKRETVFLDTKIIINSKFNTFFDVLDSKDKKIGDTFSETNFDALLNKRALKYKLSIINKMRKNLLKHFLKDSLNSKVYSTKDFDFFKLVNKNINKSFLLLYIILLATLLMSYMNIFDYQEFIFLFIMILTIPLSIIYFKNLNNISKSDFRLSLQYFMKYFSKEMVNLESTNKKIDTYGYKESFLDENLIKYEDRVKIGLADIYNSDIIIPFIPNFKSNPNQKKYLELFLINYGKLQTQRHYSDYRDLSPDYLKTLSSEKLIEVQKEISIKKEQLEKEKLESVNRNKVYEQKIEEYNIKIKERDEEIAQKYREKGYTVFTLDDINDKEKMQKLIYQSFLNLNINL